MSINTEIDLSNATVTMSLAELDKMRHEIDWREGFRRGIIRKIEESIELDDESIVDFMDCEGPLKITVDLEKLAYVLGYGVPDGIDENWDEAVDKGEIKVCLKSPNSIAMQIKIPEIEIRGEDVLSMTKTIKAAAR